LVLTVWKKNDESTYSTEMYTTDGSTRSTTSATLGSDDRDEAPEVVFPTGVGVGVAAGAVGDEAGL
jgi:hypothetical protein